MKLGIMMGDIVMDGDQKVAQLNLKAQDDGSKVNMIDLKSKTVTKRSSKLNWEVQTMPLINKNQAFG